MFGGVLGAHQQEWYFVRATRSAEPDAHRQSVGFLARQTRLKLFQKPTYSLRLHFASNFLLLSHAWIKNKSISSALIYNDTLEIEHEKHACVLQK